jgi:hypothetical protein
MTDFKILFFTGDYKWRQLAANEASLDLYVEHHFNFFTKQTNYAVVKLHQTSGTRTSKFGNMYLEAVNRRLGVSIYDSPRSDGGLLRLKNNSRDVFNLALLNCPAVIVEPLFLSNHQHVELLTNQGGVQLLANILTDTIREFFCDVDEARIGFSVGHKYQRSAPMDRGAVCSGKSELTEADLSDTILTLSGTLLSNNIPTKYTDNWLQSEPLAQE